MWHQLEPEPGVGGNPTMLRLWVVLALFLVFGHKRAQEEAVDLADQGRVVPTKEYRFAS